VGFGAQNLGGMWTNAPLKIETCRTCLSCWYGFSTTFSAHSVCSSWSFTKMSE
jgi:hypothetical protein